MGANEKAGRSPEEEADALITVAATTSIDVQLAPLYARLAELNFLIESLSPSGPGSLSPNSLKRLHDAHDEEAALAEEVAHLEWLQQGIADGTGDGDNALYHAQVSSNSADGTEQSVKDF